MTTRKSTITLGLLLVGAWLGICGARPPEPTIDKTERVDARLARLIKNFDANLRVWQKAGDRCHDCRGQMCLLILEIEAQMDRLGISPEAPSSNLVIKATADFLRSERSGGIYYQFLRKEREDRLLLALPHVETDLTPFFTELQKLVPVPIQIIDDPGRIQALRDKGPVKDPEAPQELFLDATGYPIRFGDHLSFRFDVYPMRHSYWGIYEFHGNELRFIDWCSAIP